LNSNATVDALETFLPRLHWLAITVVSAAGGEFIKWTGDGFLAWFEIPLVRAMEERVSTILHAVWQLTAIVNTTNLKVDGQEFLIRHGVTYEEDALITRLSFPTGYQQVDIIGRNVVLAFRLAGVDGLSFPGIVTQKQIARATSVKKENHITFAHWRPTKVELLIYFKGQKFGTDSLYKSVERKLPRSSQRNLIKKAKTLVQHVEDDTEGSGTHFELVRAVIQKMQDGPEWARSVLDRYLSFVTSDILGNLKKALAFFEDENRPALAGSPDAR
jgi:hypothetical protein